MLSRKDSKVDKSASKSIEFEFHKSGLSFEVLGF